MQVQVTVPYLHEQMEVCIVRISGETILKGTVCETATVSTLNVMLQAQGYIIPQGSKYCQGLTVCCMSQYRMPVSPGRWALVLPEGPGNGYVVALADHGMLFPESDARWQAMLAYHQAYVTAEMTVCGVCGSSWRSAPPDLASILNGDFDDPSPAWVYDIGAEKQECQHCDDFAVGWRNRSGYWFCRLCWQQWTEKRAAGMRLDRCAHCHLYRYSWSCRSGYSYCEACWQEWS